MLSCGIIGLPNAGKSTLFNALTHASAQVASYPFTTVEPNVGIVEVPDERLRLVAEAVHPAKTVPAAIKFVDIAGLVKNAHKGEGLGNQFLGHIREVDAIVHVVRCFEDPNVAHVEGDIDPVRDIESVNLELTFADLEVVERRISKLRKPAESGIKEAKFELEALSKAKLALEEGNPVLKADLSPDQRLILSSLNLLTDKPEIYVLNVSDDDLVAEDFGRYPELRRIIDQRDSEVVKIGAKLEAELLEFSEEESAEYLSEMGVKERGLDRLVSAAYDLLGLITFITAEPSEARAWPIAKRSTAYDAAGLIHGDIQRGFIKAEVVNWRDLVQSGSFHSCRESGKLMVEGREYRINDGEVIHFKFNV